MGRLPKTLQKYVNFMARKRRPLTFAEIVVITPGVNKFSFLERRHLITEIEPNYYKAGDRYTCPRLSEYVLSGEGMWHAIYGERQ